MELYEYVHYVLTRETDVALDGKHKQPGYSFYASAAYEILTNSHEEMYDYYWA